MLKTNISVCSGLICLLAIIYSCNKELEVNGTFDHCGVCYIGMKMKQLEKKVKLNWDSGQYTYETSCSPHITYYPTFSKTNRVIENTVAFNYFSMDTSSSALILRKFGFDPYRFNFADSIDVFNKDSTCRMLNSYREKGGYSTFIKVIILR